MRYTHKNLNILACALSAISLFLPWYTADYISYKLQFTLLEIFNLESGNYFKIPIFKMNLFAAGAVGTITLLFFGIGCLILFFYKDWGSILMAIGVGYYSYYYIGPNFNYISYSALFNAIYNKLISNIGLSLAIIAVLVGIISLLQERVRLRKYGKIHYVANEWMR